MNRHSIVGALLALVLAASCAPDASERTAATSESRLTAADRVPRYQRIRDAAAARGLHGNAFLLAAIAMHESGMAMCWSEATQHCQGPSSPECGGGPVLAGSGDGPCYQHQGGLGMFQFDAGTYADTVNAYGNGVLTIDGQVGAAIDFVVRIVKISDYTTNAETDAKSLAWLNAFDIHNGTLRDQWVRTVLRYYNGCPEGGSCWWPRYQQYDDAIDQVLADTGGTTFWAACDAGGTGPVADHYRAIGGCASVVGAPFTGELPTPDGVGRYRVYERGSIYWSPQTGAHEVHGRIRDAWKDAGWEAGPLGYPISDETVVPGGRRSDFQHGFITWTSATDESHITQQ